MKLTDVTNFNDQDRKEETANGISHGAGSVLAVAGTAVLIVFAALSGSTTAVVSSSVYGFSLILLFTMSTLYHSFKNVKVKRVFQILDHSSVYVLIFGTYTPICLSLLGTAAAWWVWGFVLLMTVVGIVLNIIDLRKFHIFSMVMYLLMGWSAVFIMGQLLEVLTIPALILLFGGGVLYSIGIVFYLVGGHKFLHLVWHIFVLGGAVLHYFFVLFYCV